MPYRYKLEPYHGPRSRHECPSCGKRGVFALYIDTETGLPVDETVGRCNREVNCGYHRKPSESGERRAESARSVRPHFALAPRTSFIPYSSFTPTLTGLEMPNNFLDWLCTLFKRERVEKAFMDYFIGTSKHWPGATIFWQIDRLANIRTGKVMLYDSKTGHRVKEPTNHISWAHKLLNIPDYNLRQCFFGEHLLWAPTNKVVAIVESEKTAVIASIFMPEFIWLAAGSLSNLNVEKCKVLRECKRVVLYPDVRGYELWKQKSRELRLSMVHVSDILEKRASPEQKKAGIDLADYLIDFYKPQL